VERHPQLPALRKYAVDLFQAGVDVCVSQRHPRNHHIELVIRPGQGFRSAADETDAIRPGSAQPQSVAVNIETTGHSVRVGGDESLPGAAPNVEHSFVIRQWRRQDVGGMARIQRDF